MDKVQIYTISLFTLSMMAGFFMDGEPRSERNHKFKDTFLNVLIMLPIIGRVLGWW